MGLGNKMEDCVVTPYQLVKHAAINSIMLGKYVD